jgi:hypothetical protein
LHLGLALAAEPDPLWRSSTTGVTVLGGTTTLDGTWSPSAEARLWLALGQGRQSAGVRGGAWSSVTAVPRTDALWLDVHGGWLEADRGPALAQVWVRGGSVGWDPWLEIAAIGGAGFGPVQLTVGPAMRGRSAGGLGRAAVWSTRGPWTWSAQVEARAWLDLPSSGDVLVSGTWHEGPWVITLGAAGWVNATTQDDLWVAGLAPGTRGVRGLGSVQRAVGPVDLLVEVNGSSSFGATRLNRVNAAVGLQWGRSRATPVLDDPQGLELSVHRPSAETVEVTGSFSDWQPVPLTRGEDGVWSLTLDIPPGRYEAILLVDGLPETIDGFPKTPDGFGGESSILTLR